MQTPENAVSLQDAVTCMKKYKKLIWCEKQSVINTKYKQGCILHSFKESETFTEMINEREISKIRINFEVNLSKLLEKYPSLKNLQTLSIILKPYFCQIKLICRTSKNEFKHFLIE